MKTFYEFLNESFDSDDITFEIYGFAMDDAGIKKARDKFKASLKAAGLKMNFRKAPAKADEDYIVKITGEPEKILKWLEDNNYNAEASDLKHEYNLK